ncbi:MAG: alpha-2-macroglobulin, partial [Anaerolineae bacterium]|nr:alpha-2-macroglobulin [Anaerolineae bacterium]
YDKWSHRKLLVASRYNLTLKRGWDEMWVWATDLVGGQPAGGLKLTAVDTYGTALASAMTDADGLARFSLDTTNDVYVVAQEPFVLAGTAWDWSTGISPWDFGLESEAAYPHHRAHVYTDRPIYRPGQTVYFRGVVRMEDDVQYSLPEGRRIEVNIYDATGEEIYNEMLELDEFGAFHGKVALTEGASLGGYYISARLGEDGFSAMFQVAAYRPPEFEVTVTPRKTELAAGQITQADVEVSYFFGGPVADASVEWRILAAPYRFEPAQFGRYDFTDGDDPWICRWCWWWEEPAPEFVLGGSGSTNAKGQLTVVLPAQVMTGGRRLTIEATVYGRDGQVISGRGDVVVHKGEFYVGLAPQQVVGEAGEEMAVDVVTVDWAGERLPGQDLAVEVYRREWINTFVENECGDSVSDCGGHWEWETKDTLVYSGKLTTDARAEGVAAFAPEEGGSYRVVVSGRDSRERSVRSSTWVWVSGREYVSWQRQNNDRVNLISDKTSYVPGETAEILIPSPFAGEHWAWITVERGGILKQEVLQLESNSTVYRLPITANHAPDIYVSAVIFKGPDATEPVATHKVGYVMLTIEPVVQTLNVTLTPSVDQAGPGDTVSFDVQAHDADGNPVQAAFSLDLVDKAVLSLQPRTPDAINAAFYGRRGLGISTYSGMSISINRLLEEEIEDLKEMALGMGGGGEDVPTTGGGGEELPPAPSATPVAEGEAPAADRAASKESVLPPGVELREEFADTAFWDATVVTDGSGRATVEIALPDNLTTWVLRGVGATTDTQVGEGTVELLVTKPLLVRPVTPRFFVVDDRVQLAALVSNNTGKAQKVEVTLLADGVRIDGEASQQVSIPDGGEAKVTWWVEVKDVEVVEVVMSAVAGEYSDAAKPRLTTGPGGTLLVYRYTAPEIVGTGGQLVGEDARTEAIALPPKYDDRQGELSVRLDPSLAAGMRDGLTYLEHYPYECTEQIVSRFLPNVLTYQALKRLEIRDQELEARLPGLVEQGVDKLVLRQNGDGGWGWWYAGESNPHLSAYVVFGLVLAQEAGFEVPASVLQRGLSYLESTLVSARNLQSYREANRQAFVLYVMAEAGETKRVSEYVGDLFDRRDKLNHYGRAFLAMTMGLVDAGDSRVKTLLSDLQNDAILSATGAHWEEANYDWWAMNTDTRSTAVILDALVHLDPDNALIPQVVRWLMVARQDGIWETTQETAWALVALTDWMVVTGELEGEYEYGAWLNGDILAEGTVTPATIDESVHLRVGVAELLADASNLLTIARGPGEGRLYYTAHLKVYLPVEEIEPLNRGVIVQRRYVDPECTQGPKCPEVEQAAVGDVVQVRLTIIAPHDLYYVVVEDPLPAGAEAIDTSLATTSLVA